MFAPIFQIVSADAAVKLLLGAGTSGHPVRFYPFGEAPSGVTLPYVVWQNIGGSPENFINDRPVEDHFICQVDVYGATAESVRLVSKALNDALETEAHIVRFGNENRDSATKNYHYDFDVEFLSKR